MKMIEITKEKFNEFANKSKYNNFLQTEYYAQAMKYMNYRHLYIAYTTNDLEILASGMFLIKYITPTVGYAYCPGGFIIDYEDKELVRKFSKNIVKFLKRKNIIFLKTNPFFPIATIDYKKNYTKKMLPTNEALEEMKKAGFMRRKEIEPLTLYEPKISAILNLKDYSINNLDENTKRIITDSQSDGYEIIYEDVSKIDALSEMTNPILKEYYKNIYNAFKKDENCELILLKINYEKYLASAKAKTEKEQEINDFLNDKLQKENNEENLNKKMLSDKILEEYKQEVIKASEGLKNRKDEYLAGALIIKHNKIITILAAGLNKERDQASIKYYLYNKIFELYKNDFDYCNLYGIANNFEKNSQYEEFNNFKLCFNPDVYEYAGELDIIIKKLKYKIYSNNITFTRFK